MIVALFLVFNSHFPPLWITDTAYEAAVIRGLAEEESEPPMLLELHEELPVEGV